MMETSAMVVVSLLLKLLFSSLFIAATILLLYIYLAACWRPERLRHELRKQGVDGPRPTFPYGNLAEMRRLAAAAKRERSLRRSVAGDGPAAVRHDYAATLLPHLVEWEKRYGPSFSYMVGNVVAVHMSGPEVVRDLTLCSLEDVGRGTYLKKTHEPLFGQGIFRTSGQVWAHQRKIMAPEFFLDRVKRMVEMMVESAEPLLGSWEERVDRNGGAADINVDQDLRTYSADVISRACFGSSYEDGKEIFLKLRELQKLVREPNMLAEITGINCRYLPTKRNREAWKLSREVRELILKLVDGSQGEHNLLRAILESASDGAMKPAEAESFVVDNCKSIYFAGHETTAVTAAWCLMLLCLHPEWQERVRQEVRDVCADQRLDSQGLQKMKLLTMVIQETLRLYPPGAMISRSALRDTTLGGIRIPRGVNVYVPVPALHHDKKLWGDDVHEFKPERFAPENRSRRPAHGYVPFGVGARVCLGQAFAMTELRAVLALLVDRFTFSLSPKYVHSPAFGLIVEPEFGVDLVVAKATHASNFALKFR